MQVHVKLYGPFSLMSGRGEFEIQADTHTVFIGGGNASPSKQDLFEGGISCRNVFLVVNAFQLKPYVKS